MTNFIPLEAKNGKTVEINQVRLEQPEKVAVALGYTVEEFRARYPDAFRGYEVKPSSQPKMSILYEDAILLRTDLPKIEGMHPYTKA